MHNEARVFEVSWSELETAFDERLSGVRANKAALESLVTNGDDERNAVIAQLQGFADLEERLTYLQKHLTRETVRLSGGELLNLRARLRPDGFDAKQFLDDTRARLANEKRWAAEKGMEAGLIGGAVMPRLLRDEAGGW